MNESPLCRYCGSKDTMLCEHGTPPAMWAWRCNSCRMVTEGWQSKEALLNVLNQKPKPKPITKEVLEQLGFSEPSHTENAWFYPPYDKILYYDYFMTVSFNEDGTVQRVSFRSMGSSLNIGYEKAKHLTLETLLIMKAAILNEE